MTGLAVGLRCPGDHWGFAHEATGRLEVRCTAKHCRTADGLAVIHDFDLATGSFVTSIAPQLREAETCDRTPPEEVHHGR